MIIYKYPLQSVNDHMKLLLPAGFLPLKIDLMDIGIGKRPFLWGSTSGETKLLVYTVVCVYTGEIFPFDVKTYIGTLIFPDNKVLHYYLKQD